MSSSSFLIFYFLTKTNNLSTVKNNFFSTCKNFKLLSVFSWFFISLFRRKNKLSLLELKYPNKTFRPFGYQKRQTFNWLHCKHLQQTRGQNVDGHIAKSQIWLLCHFSKITHMAYNFVEKSDFKNFLTWPYLNLT